MGFYASNVGISCLPILLVGYRVTLAVQVNVTQRPCWPISNQMSTKCQMILIEI